MRLTLQSLADLPRIAQEVHTRLADYPVIALQGDLGAGKTTLVHELCRLDGASEEEVVNSPTFAIVNVYTTQSDDTCLLYTSPSPRDMRRSRMPSSA